MGAGDWTDAENDAIVADYFAMLLEDLSGRSYNKAAFNRGLQATTGRSHGSIEFKLQNVSAVLRALGEEWIPGYKPAVNFQDSLIDAVERWLATHPGWSAHATAAGQAAYPRLHDDPVLWIGPPPMNRNEPPPAGLDRAMQVALRRDVAERDARNRVLGRAGEKRVLAHERATLSAAGRQDLASRVRWVSEEEGDGAGYDIASFLPDGRDRLIEVKTTNGWERTPFHISRNELAVAERRREEWHLVRLWKFARDPRAFELRPPLDRYLELTPTNFLASLR